MADLAISPQHTESRGQLILVTALTLAAIFLGLAVIVNSAIFTENLATRSENVESTEALEYRHSVEQYVGDTIGFANENNDSSYSDIEDSVRDSVTDAGAYSGVQHAADGASVSLDFDSSTPGARIYQTDGTEFTTNGTNASDWTLATDIANTRALELDITSVSGDFRIIADNGSADWELEVRNTGSNVEVSVENPDGASDTCTYTTVESIHVTDGTVNGSPCPALIDTEAGDPLQFAATFDGPYEIRFDDGDEIEGNYSVVVDNSSVSSIRDDDFAEQAGPGTAPYVSPAMYSATVELVYKTARVSYETEITAAPGEPQ